MHEWSRLTRRHSPRILVPCGQSEPARSPQIIPAGVRAALLPAQRAKSNSQITSPASLSPRPPNSGTKARALLLSWGLTSQPRSPKRLGHRIAAGGPGIASACTRVGGSETFLRSRWAEFGACRRRPRSRGFLEPHRQRDPTALRRDFQNLDTDDIAGLRDLAWVLDVSNWPSRRCAPTRPGGPRHRQRRRTRRRSSRHLREPCRTSDLRAFPSPLGSSPF
jgi:hypothetical protein